MKHECVYVVALYCKYEGLQWIEGIFTDVDVAFDYARSKGKRWWYRRHGIKRLVMEAPVNQPDAEWREPLPF